MTAVNRRWPATLTANETAGRVRWRVWTNRNRRNTILGILVAECAITQPGRTESLALRAAPRSASEPRRLKRSSPTFHLFSTVSKCHPRAAATASRPLPSPSALLPAVYFGLIRVQPNANAFSMGFVELGASLGRFGITDYTLDPVSFFDFHAFTCRLLDSRLI